MGNDRVNRVLARQDARRAAQGLPTADEQQAATDAKVLRMAAQNPGDATLREVAGQVQDRLDCN